MKPNKKIYNRAKELYCDATIFVFRFFIVYLLKKIWTKQWPKAADSPLIQRILKEKKNKWIQNNSEKSLIFF